MSPPIVCERLKSFLEIKGGKEIRGCRSGKVVLARFCKQHVQTHSSGILNALFDAPGDPRHIQNIGDNGFAEYISDVLPNGMPNPRSIDFRCA